MIRVRQPVIECSSCGATLALPPLTKRGFITKLRRFERAHQMCERHKQVKDAKVQLDAFLSRVMERA